MKKAKVKQMVGIALLIALIVVLQAIGGMIPPIGGFSISLVLMPIVLGAAMYGPSAGALLGAAFGAIVYINCVTGADVGGAMVFQANPVLCFIVVLIKGILAGLVSGIVYKLLKKVNLYVAIICAAIICPIVNTGVFITCMFLFFIDVLGSRAGGGDLVGYVLTGLVFANFIPELIINVILSPVSQRVINVIKKG